MFFQKTVRLRRCPVCVVPLRHTLIYKASTKTGLKEAPVGQGPSTLRTKEQTARAARVHSFYASCRNCRTAVSSSDPIGMHMRLIPPECPYKAGDTDSLHSLVGPSWTAVRHGHYWPTELRTHEDRTLWAADCAMVYGWGDIARYDVSVQSMTRLKHLLESWNKNYYHIKESGRFDTEQLYEAMWR